MSQIREVKSGSGYLSQNDMRLHFGLGEVNKVDSLEVRWLCGHTETIKDVDANQIFVIKER